MRLRTETAKLLEFLSVQPEFVASAEVAESMGYGVINARHRLRAMVRAEFAYAKNVASPTGAYQTRWYVITDKGREELAFYIADAPHRRLARRRNQARPQKQKPKSLVTSVFNYGASL